MATEGLRQSTRVRQPVKNYAEQALQNEEDELASNAPPPKRKRKKSVDDVESNHGAAKAPKRAKKVAKAPEGSSPKASSAAGGKKPAKATSSKPKRSTTNNSWHADAAERRIAVSKRNTEKLGPDEPETRLREHVTEPSQSYHNALKKANKERMFVLDRERGVEEDCHANHHDCPCEKVQMAGSTGNVYIVTISHLPSCTCPAGIYNRKGGEKLCKHAIYVLHNVLKAPDHLKQQNAFLTSELKELFSEAPALPSAVAEDQPMDGNRKPLEDDCPICCMEFEEGDEIVWYVCRRGGQSASHRQTVAGSWWTFLSSRVIQFL